MPAARPIRPTVSEFDVLDAAAELQANKDQPDGYAGLDSNGDIAVTGIIPNRDTQYALSLEVGEIGTSRDGDKLFVGTVSGNATAGICSDVQINVVPSSDTAQNGADAIAAYEAAVTALVTNGTKTGVGYINDGSISNALTETTFDVNDGTAFAPGDLLTWGTDGTGSGTFDDATFATEWMVVSVVSGNTLTVVRTRAGTNDSIATTLDLYKVNGSPRYTVRLFAGDYDLTGEAPRGINATVTSIDVVGEGSRSTHLYRSDNADYVNVITLSGLVNLTGVKCSMFDSVGGIGRVAINLASYGGILTDIYAFGEGGSSPSPIFGSVRTHSIPTQWIDVSIECGNTAIGAGASFNGDLTIVRCRSINAGPILFYGIAGELRLEDCYFLGKSDAAVILYPPASVVAYNTTINVTGSATMSFYGDTISVTVAHCRLNKEVDNYGAGSNVVLADWNTIATAYNVIDTAVV